MSALCPGRSSRPDTTPFKGEKAGYSANRFPRPHRGQPTGPRPTALGHTHNPRGPEPGLASAGEAADGAEAVALARCEKPDVISMDIRMPSMDGIEATRRITADPDARASRVLILTTYNLDEYVFAALRAGASGFLLKDTRPADLLVAVRVVGTGAALLAPSITRRLTAEFTSRPEPRHQLAAALKEITEGEREVLTLIGLGYSNTDAARLHVSHSSVKAHIGRLLVKLSARDRVQLVITAYDTGLVHSAS